MAKKNGTRLGRLNIDGEFVDNSQVLKFILEQVELNGYSPTTTTIMKQFKFPRHVDVTLVVNQLIRNGKLERELQPFGEKMRTMTGSLNAVGMGRVATTKRMRTALRAMLWERTCLLGNATPDVQERATKAAQAAIDDLLPGDITGVMT